MELKIQKILNFKAMSFIVSHSSLLVVEPFIILYMGHYQKMEQSLSLMVFSQARCPRFAFSMYNISFRGALLEPHAISRFRVRYLQKRDARSAILSIFTVSQGQGK